MNSFPDPWWVRAHYTKNLEKKQMKKMMKKFAVYGMVGLSMLTGSALANAEEVGEYASSMNSSAPIPAGHFALLAHYADEFLSANNGTGGHRTVYAQSLMDGVNDPALADDISDYYLLDIRRPADYAAGHIAGAVNVQLADVANPGVLASLPEDKPILVICYTGHTASIANAILGSLGYNAWTLRFGMTSWKAATPTAVWSSSVKQSIAGGDFPMVTGMQP